MGSWVPFRVLFIRVPYCFGSLKRDPNLENCPDTSSSALSLEAPTEEERKEPQAAVEEPEHSAEGDENVPGLQRACLDLPLG